jgi:hypothetical protein
MGFKCQRILNGTGMDPCAPVRSHHIFSRLGLTPSNRKDEPVRDLDWTTTSDLQSVLAVGFTHKIMLICEQRMSYVESTPGWAPILTIDLERYVALYC